MVLILSSDARVWKTLRLYPLCSQNLILWEESQCWLTRLLPVLFSNWTDAKSFPVSTSGCDRWMPAVLMNPWTFSLLSLQFAAWAQYVVGTHSYPSHHEFRNLMDMELPWFSFCSIRSGSLHSNRDTTISLGSPKSHQNEMIARPTVQYKYSVMLLAMQCWRVQPRAIPGFP